VRLLVEDRKILADSLPIDGRSGNLVHDLICFTRSCAPAYSDATAADAFAWRGPAANP
jgi:hypothetical protein